jgi:uncharacterized BrkB/YihY/UPF0761 family membrane protein
MIDLFSVFCLLGISFVLFGYFEYFSDHLLYRLFEEYIHDPIMKIVNKIKDNIQEAKERKRLAKYVSRVNQIL